ncbi:hypothetical protein NHH03_12825 [Stieleria sp. TO1_6]|nr:hypothetical protein [Stieleria tagensis]
MLHEWDVEDPPIPLPRFVLQSRQAVKIANWLTRHNQVLAGGDVDLVIQSELPSSQLSAIVEVTATTLNWPIENQSSVRPHLHTRLLLEMATASTSLEQEWNPFAVLQQPHAVSKSVNAVGTLFQFHNVDLVVSTKIEAIRNGVSETMRRVAKSIVSSIVPEAVNSSVADAASDFIAGVITVRGTQIFRPTTLSKMTFGTNAAERSILVLEPTMECVTQLYSNFPGTIHWFATRVNFPEAINLKSWLLSRGAWMLETMPGDLCLRSINRRPDPMSEVLHHQIRQAS